MTEKVEGIVIDIVRHNDRHNVVTLFTRSRGRVAMLVPVGKSRAGMKRNSTIMLMACITGQVNFKSGRELQSLTSVAPLRVWRSIYFNPVKSSLVFFLTEFLGKFLRQSPPDPVLWDYIVSSLATLDALDDRRLANFHIAFLCGLLSPAGIRPTLEGYEEGMVFDMRQAEFRDPAHPGFLQQGGFSPANVSTLLTPTDSRFLRQLSRINYRNMHLFRLSREQRAHLLERLLQYYSLHLSTSFNLKSLEILKEVVRV